MNRYRDTHSVPLVLGNGERFLAAGSFQVVVGRRLFASGIYDGAERDRIPACIKQTRQAGIQASPHGHYILQLYYFATVRQSPLPSPTSPPAPSFPP